MKRLVLIDGHALLHRAYHAFPLTLTTRKGELVNAVYGFTRILLGVLTDLKPHFLVVAMDLPGETFRHKEYLGYQVQRPQMDDELSGQIKRVWEIIGALNIPLFAQQEYEADDIIGTLAQKVVKKKAVEVIIVTGDKDIMQLIEPKIKVYVPRKGFAEPEMFDQKKVKEVLGINPSQIIDYKALIGDSSDNYPGVPGIGPKTAVGLLEKYGSFQKIYQNLGKIKPLVAEKLKAGKSSGLLSKKLATIITNVPLKFSLEKCLLHDYDQQKAVKLFEELEFRSLINKLPGMEKNIISKKPKEEKRQMSLL
jgi:DNA polymerase I